MVRRSNGRPATSVQESYRALLLTEGLIAYAGLAGLSGIVALVSRTGNSVIFLAMAATTASIGIFCRRRLTVRPKLSTADAIIGLALVWGLLVALGAGTYLALGTSTSVVDATFESAAGFSTVAATTVATDSLSTAEHLFRAGTQWVGGLLGLFAAAVALPATMKGRVQIPKGEGSKSNRLAPDLVTGRLRILQIYGALTVLCWLGYLGSGLGLRSSVVHAFGTVSTGGFSDRADSLATAPMAAQIVATVFMVIAGCSYYVLFWLIRGNVTRFQRSPELRIYLSIIIGMALWSLWQIDGLSFGDALFTAASASSSTGYAVIDWTAANDAMLAGLLFAVATGAMSASAGSGLRVIRAWLLALVVGHALRSQLDPSTVAVVRHRGRTVEAEEIDSLTGYQFSHFGLFALGAFVLTLTGDTMIDALWTSVSMVSTFGPSPTMGPFGDANQLSDIGRLAMIPGMLAGRLSIFPLLIGVTSVLQARRWLLRRLRRLTWRLR